SGTGDWSQDCAHTPDCHYSGVRSDGTTYGSPGVNGTYGDGLRFNPHQQDRGLYPDDISLGMSLVSQIRYESVLPGISVGPQIIFKYDIYNTTPGLASNYIEGRIIWDTLVEVRYKSALSFNVGYRTVAGGGVANNLGDRDEARVYLKYAF
ncbi:MAG: DUF1302 family protein, partial [Panacagrimonas sp.]